MTDLEELNAIVQEKGYGDDYNVLSEKNLFFVRDKDSTKAFGGYMFVKTYLLSLKYKGDTAEDQIINFIRNNNKRTNE